MGRKHRKKRLIGVRRLSKEKDILNHLVVCKDKFKQHASYRNPYDVVKFIEKSGDKETYLIANDTITKRLSVNEFIFTHREKILYELGKDLSITKEKILVGQKKNIRQKEKLKNLVASPEFNAEYFDEISRYVDDITLSLYRRHLKVERLTRVRDNILGIISLYEMKPLYENSLVTV